MLFRGTTSIFHVQTNQKWKNLVLIPFNAHDIICLAR